MNYLPFFLLPFILSLVFTPLVRSFAFKGGFISYPRPDRWHKHPTALLGGLSIYLAFIISALVLGLINKNSLGVFVGATLLFVVGLIDDKVHFTPYTKLFAQILAGGIAVLAGIVLKLPLGTVLFIPLTLLWIVAITNAFNLLDNIDGLAAGIAAISAFMLFVTSYLFSHSTFGIFALVVFGACLGFLPYNFNPAKIFMGDSGSMFLGYLLAVISISESARFASNLLATILLPVFILSVPIFDTLFVMITRLLQKRSIFKGGRDHTSHHLVALGLSPRKTVLLFYTISIIFGLISVVSSRADWIPISIVAFLGMVILMILGIFLFEGISPEKKGYRAVRAKEKTILNNVFLHKRRVVEVLMDFVFICIAYYCAYYLRFEDVLLAGNLALMRESFIWVILIKMSVFFLTGLYRGVWRYVSIPDFLTMFKSISIASVSVILFLTLFFRFKDYSRAVFFIDWLLLLFLLIGSRFLFRILGEFFSNLRKKGGVAILILGAGDTGEMVVREIKKNREADYHLVGFIDDDPYKLGAKIQGVSILGTRNKIRELAIAKGIKEIIIAIPSLNAEGVAEIEQISRECGILCRKVKTFQDNLNKLHEDK